MLDRYCRVSRPHDGATVTMQPVGRYDRDEFPEPVEALERVGRDLIRQDVRDPVFMCQRTKRDAACASAANLLRRQPR